MKTTIGLEFHIRLVTRTKAFSAEALAAPDALPNTAADSLSRGEPGSLPVVNKTMVEKGIILALAAEAVICDTLEFDRKHYFYPDLPKGYQITQHRKPLAQGGIIKIVNSDGSVMKLPLREMHLEEDSAKSLLRGSEILLDVNRAGIPLIEVVTEPAIGNAGMAAGAFTALQDLVKYLRISEARPEQGSIRCDANISVTDDHGQNSGRVEIKNMNSTAALKAALQYEEKRLMKKLSEGELIKDETRAWDDLSLQTRHERFKESSVQYRYLPEWDLPPIHLDKRLRDRLAGEMPVLPAEMFIKLQQQYNIPPETAKIISSNRFMSDVFQQVENKDKNAAIVSNWLRGPLRNSEKKITDINLAARNLSQLAQLVLDSKISESAARQIIHEAASFTKGNVAKLAAQKNVIIRADSVYLLNLVERILVEYPEEVRKYRNGKRSVLGFFMGKMMESSRGRIDPVKANELLKEKLEKDEEDH